MSEYEIEYAERVNKTQQKREMLALRALGEHLTELSESQLEKIPLSEKLNAAIIEAKRLKKSARKRQLKYIEGLMRDIDVVTIQQALETLQKPHHQAIKQFHQLENWRDTLVSGDDTPIEAILTQHPHTDRQHLRQLVRNARKEKQTGKNTKNAKALFRYLSELVQA